jgi:hypothetical protein
VRKRSGRLYVNQSISFTPEQLAMARARAHSRGLSLSHYVRECIALDYRMSLEAEPAGPDRGVAETKDPTLEARKFQIRATPPETRAVPDSEAASKPTPGKKKPRPDASR